MEGKARSSSYPFVSRYYWAEEYRILQNNQIRQTDGHSSSFKDFPKMFLIAGLTYSWNHHFHIVIFSLLDPSLFLDPTIWWEECIAVHCVPGSFGIYCGRFLEMCVGEKDRSDCHVDKRRRKWKSKNLFYHFYTQIPSKNVRSNESQ